MKKITCDVCETEIGGDNLTDGKAMHIQIGHDGAGNFELRFDLCRACKEPVVKLLVSMRLVARFEKPE